MKMQVKKTLAAAACAAALGGMTGTAQAANWLALQGTEPPGQAPRARLWGFIQPEYQSTSGTKLKAGAFSGQNAVFNQVRPDLKTNEGFNVIRARVGVRGAGFPLDTKTNYFFLAEFGNNGITRQGGGSAKITDASVTFNHIKGMRVRVGQFKHPGAEEGLQAIHVFDYINFTNVTNQLLLERFFDGDGSTTAGNGTGCPSGGGTAASCANKPNGPVSAFRDVGIQLFEIFKSGNWEHSYAIMYGNGNGITRGDNDDNKELYLYWSSEQVYGGKGPRREGWKLFAWRQDGKRTLTGAGDTGGAGEYDRTRSGIGTTFRRGRHRAAFEYITADGMIFNGTDGGAVAGSINNGGNGIASFNVATKGEADGWYIHYGYAPTPKWELDVRYDVLNRLTNNSSAERKFETWTLGVQYFFNKKTRLILNYEIRDAEAPNLSGSATPNQILDSMDDRLALQILAIF